MMNNSTKDRNLNKKLQIYTFEDEIDFQMWLGSFEGKSNKEQKVMKKIIELYIYSHSREEKMDCLFSLMLLVLAQSEKSQFDMLVHAAVDVHR